MEQALLATAGLLFGGFITIILTYLLSRSRTTCIDQLIVKVDNLREIVMKHEEEIENLAISSAKQEAEYVGIKEILTEMKESINKISDKLEIATIGKINAR